MARPRRSGRAAIGPAALMAIALSLLTSSPAPAGAEEVSGQELASLAQRAGHDPRALERLRRVDRVDGRAVDVRRALDGPETAERVRLLAEGSVRPVPSTGGAADAADEARRDAEDILDERRFQPRRAPRPLAGALRRIGGWLRPVGEPLGALVEELGGRTRVLGALAVAVVILAALVAVSVVRRRTAADGAARRSALRPARARPEDLERQADVAEREGQLDLAYRLRFEAGLIRLHDAGRLHLRASLTTGEVLRTVPSATLGQLTTKLEEIVYAGRGAEAPDLDAARSGWPRVLEEARR